MFIFLADLILIGFSKGVRFCANARTYDALLASSECA
jgi:hypothetical protein